MTDFVKIAVDAMGGEGSPKKTIDGIVHNHLSSKDNFYKIFGDKTKILNELIEANIDNKLIDNVFNISQKQLETLKNKIIDHNTPDTVQDVYVEFLKSKSND